MVISAQNENLKFYLLRERCKGFIFQVKGTVMQIEKTLVNDQLRVSEVYQKFRISTIYNFAVIYP